MNSTALYQQQGVIDERLLEEHLSLVKRIAIHLAVRLPDGVDMDDLQQVGLMGLLAAARKYVPGGDASFTTYASIRIRGAILDEIRKHNWAPRLALEKSTKISRAINRVEARISAPATDRQIADELDLSMNEYHRLVSEAATTELLFVENSDHLPLAGNEADPMGQLLDAGLKEKLVDVIEGLPEREATVMALYYQEELNLREIGDVLGVTESRISQIHSQAVVRIRSKLGEWMHD